MRPYEQFEVDGLKVSIHQDTDAQAPDRDGDDCDSCWGFYGLEYCKAEATSAAKYWLEHESKAERQTAEVCAL